MTMLQRRILGFAFFALFGLVLLGVGVRWVVLRQTSPHYMAKVSTCDVSGTGKNRRVTCQGSWVEGDLTSGGHVGVSDIDGADTDDVGKSIEVFVYDGKAYTLGWGMPAMFFALGVACFIAGVYVWRYPRKPAVKK
jgi:hypothetical protein